MRVGLRTVLDEGWLAFDAIKLTSLSAPIAARPGQDHTLAAQVSGQLEGADAARLFIRYSDGTIGTVWQNESGFNGSQSVSGDFTTPAGAASFQVGTEVMLDQGYLSWTNVTLTAYSAAFPVTEGGAYQFTGQVTGALAASLGQGGRITAMYANAAGQSAEEDLLWQNPANFNGTVSVQQTFTANADAAALRLALTVNLAAGHLAFGDIDLQYLTAGDIIRRSTYMLAGQAVAVRVVGDPDLANNGLFYLYSDHLGSASAVQKSDGSAPLVTRYLPFGGYRDGSGPNQVTDRGFTGHKHNDDLGLVYMNARFYVSYLNRFLSADPIVPNPANPQSLNRYSYVLNRPLNFSDPTGHRECGADCNNPLPYSAPPPSPFYSPFLDFTGEGWTDDDKQMLHQAASLLGSRMANAVNRLERLDARLEGTIYTPISPVEAFRGIFDGRVTINKSSQACTVATDCVAWVNNGETIVNIENGFNNLTAHLMIHEIFHILDLTVLGGAANQAVADIQDADIGFPNRPDLNGPSDLRWGFAGSNFSNWQKSRSGLSGEEFADMGIGWTYIQWETLRTGGWSDETWPDETGSPS